MEGFLRVQVAISDDYMESAEMARQERGSSGCHEKLKF